MATDEQMQRKFTASDFMMRTREVYEGHCQLLTTDPVHMATTYGITRSAALNRLMYFHITEGLAPDVMQDLLEGAVKMEIKAMLQMYIYEQHYFSLHLLNKRLLLFKYPAVDKVDKPSPITEKHLKAKNHNLKQSAMQMWTLARYLLTIIGDLIPENDKQWETYLVLLDILDICLAPSTTCEQASHLAMLIKTHHESFKEAYPHAP
jgi:hypothetical protein